MTTPLFDPRVRYKFVSDLTDGAKWCEGELLRHHGGRIIHLNVMTLDVWKADPRSAEDPDVGRDVLPGVWLTSGWAIPTLVIDAPELTYSAVTAAVAAWCGLVDLSYIGVAA